MQAVLVTEWGGPEVLKLTDVPMPKPGEGEVVVKLFAAGVNPVETYIRAGLYAKKPKLPWVPGSEGAGIVAGLGEGVKNLKIGDRVFVVKTSGSSGTYAEFCIAAENGGVYPLPEHVSFEEGAAIGVAYRTAYRALFIRTRTRPGMTVLVHGASGAVGLACVHLANSVGAVVLGTSSPPGKKVVLAAGAREVFNHHETGYMNKIKESTGGRGVDIIVEMLANVNLAADMKILAKGGTIAVVGNRGTIDNVNARDLMMCEGHIVGVLGGTPADAREGYLATLAALEKQVFTPVVGSKYALEKASEAHVEVIAHSKGTAGKIVLTIAK